jgi:hypothetical protein
MSDERLLRALVEQELAYLDIARTPGEIAHIVAERLAFERDLKAVRTVLDPVIAPSAFARLLSAERP